MKLKLLIVLLVCLIMTSAQQCRNRAGWRVDWFVILQFPDSVSTGYAYFDSRSASPTFAVYTEEPDTTGTPLSRTLDQIANLSMYTTAWNDQTPLGTESTTKAHSKSINAYDPKSQQGFIIVHSIPQYPNFTNLAINKTIDLSQQKFGQHILCISGDKQFMLKMISKIMPIRPFMYNQNYDCQNIINETIHAVNTPPEYNELFTYMNYTRNGTEWNMIFKNGYKNSSIFQDGLNNMIGSSLLAQTWGRPLQLPWCGGQYTTGNVKEISINQNISWLTSQDHSKWVVSISTNHSCFGDMNRMQSQWARGGAFYCIKSDLLNQAMKNMIKNTETCAQA